MAIAPRRQRQKRQRAHEGAKLLDGTPFQKHQRSGRRTKRLRGSGHRISFSGLGPLSRGDRPVDQWKTQASWNRLQRSDPV
jgi:hypothetical protein